MPIDANIAMGYQPVQMESPLNLMSKAMAIKNAVNQNALAQYQLSSAQRADTIANAMNEAYRQAINPQTGEIDPAKLRTAIASAGAGAKLPEVEKGLVALDEARNKRDLEFNNLVGKRLELSRARLETLDPMDPNAAQQYMSWHEANHADPVLAKYFNSIGVKAEDSRANIIAKITDPQTGAINLAGLAQAINASKLGADKVLEQHFASQNLGGTQRELAMPKYGAGAATVVPGSVGVNTPTPGQVLTDKRGWAKLDRGTLGITPDQEDALTRAIDGGLLDPKMVNSRNAHILANVALKNPSADFNRLAGNAAMLRNVGYQQKAQAAETLPTILSNLEESGKKLNYNDNKWIAGLQAWEKGVNQDPQLIDYMTQRNDSLLMIANVARGVGMSDFATKLEQEISSPNMSPKALASYVAAQRKSLEPRLASYRRHSIETPAPRTAPTAPAASVDHSKKTDAEILAELGVQR